MRRRRILVVEDDPLLLEALTTMLEEEGFEAAGAGSGEEALAEASRRSFDLVVTDVRMPGLDGMSMLGRLRERSVETRAVVITGFSDFHVPVEAIRLQVDDFITKPFNDDTFLRSIRRSLEFLDRQEWWRRSLEQADRDSRQILEWMVAGIVEPVTARRAHRFRDLARAVASAVPLAPEAVEVVGWSALLFAVAAPGGLAEAGSRLEGLVSDQTEVAEDRSLVRLLRNAVEHARQPDRATVEAAILRAVSRFDALAHPGDASMGLSRRECLQVMKPGWNGLDGVWEALEKALLRPAPGPDPEIPEPGNQAALALGLGYLQGGHPARAAGLLARSPRTPVALTGLALARIASGDLAGGLTAAEEAREKSCGPLETADALSMLGAARIASGDLGGEENFAVARDAYARAGALRGEVRTLLLQAWAWTRAPSRGALDEVVGALLDRVESSGLGWVLQRDRWLALEVLRQAGPRLASRAESWRLRLLGIRGAPAEEPALVVEGLGPLRIVTSGSEVPDPAWRTAKSRSLFLVLLLHEGREVPAERLVDLFWEERDADRALNSLYSALTFIRRALGLGKPVDPVVHRRGRCRFNLEVPHRVDFFDFKAQIDKGLARWDQGDVQGALPQLAAGLDQYRGDLLENYEEPWIHPYRRDCRQLAVRALERMIEHHQTSGNEASCTTLAEQLLAIDRCHQGAYQCLMRLAMSRGQPERAARLYRACERSLAEELHIAPSAATTALFAALS